MISSLKTGLLISFIALSNAINSQSVHGIQLSFSFGSLAWSIADSQNQSNDSSVLIITELKFYISKIQFLKNGKLILEEKNSFHLVDAKNKTSFNIPIDSNENIEFDELKFNMGIDSATNVSGAMGGDLDPTKGMYWTWQSGYINFKLEGKSNVCNSRNKEFIFHIGGYQYPFYALQTFSFLVKSATSINLKLDVQEILKQIDLSKQYHIMSPSVEAVLLSKIVAHSFTLSPK